MNLLHILNHIRLLFFSYIATFMLSFYRSDLSKGHIARTSSPTIGESTGTVTRPPSSPLRRLKSLEKSFVEFRKYINASLVEGRDGDGKKSMFVPTNILEAYWTQKKIRDVLHARKVVQQEGIILRRYLRVFSTLVFMDRLEVLTNFIQENLEDSWWLRNEMPPSWRTEHHLQEWCEEFRQERWKFFPLKLHPDYLGNCRVHPKYILPIKSEEKIYESGGTSVCKVSFHESCNDLGKDERKPSKEFYVVKSYQKRRKPPHVDYNTRLFENEHTARTILDSYNSDNILKFYGSFTQNNTYNLILDWANGGSLGDLFRSKPPTTPHELLQFWRSLGAVLKGLAYVHDGQKDGQDHWLMVHQDIKPDNILISRPDGGNEKSFDFSPLLADFGHSQRKLMNSEMEDDGLVPDRRGNQTYCAPECCMHNEYRLKTANSIGTPADIFSTGAVFSDAVIWTHQGSTGREAYRRRRRARTAQIHQFKGSGYDICFHDSINRLDVVDEEHRTVIAQGGPLAGITQRVVEVIEKHALLGPAKQRHDAHQLFQALQQALDTAERELQHLQGASYRESSAVSQSKPDPNPLITPPRSHKQFLELSTPHPTEEKEASGLAFRTQLQAQTPSPVGPLVSDPFREATGSAMASYMPPTLTMQEAHEYRVTKKRKTLDPDLEDKVAKLHTNLSGRDHIFFIDDTRSMWEHRAELEQAVQDLAYIAKTIDRDGIELAFASSIHTRTIYRARNSTDLTKILAQHQYAQLATRFEDSMNTLVDQVIIPRLPVPMLGRIWPLWRKPISVFVFTDGIWNGGRVDDGPGACGVETPIHNLMDEIVNRRVSRTQIMIQFIRFGHDPSGIKHLRYLDDFGQSLSCDVVDTRPVQGNVYSMFIGSISRADDNIEDDEASVQTCASNPPES